MRRRAQGRTSIVAAAMARALSSVSRRGVSVLSRHETCRLSDDRVGVEAMWHRVDAVAATASRCVAAGPWTRAQLHAIDASSLRKKGHRARTSNPEDRVGISMSKPIN